MKRVTKKLKGEYIKTKLATVPAWALRGLMVVYNNQTETEKAIEATSAHNNIGFTGTDGHFFTSLAKQYERRGSLSEKQMGFVMKRMKKYWKQIMSVTDEKKLVACMHKDGILSSEDVEAWEQNMFLVRMDKV
jgi:hypothetical protein